MIKIKHNNTLQPRLPSTSLKLMQFIINMQWCIPMICRKVLPTTYRLLSTAGSKIWRYFWGGNGRKAGLMGHVPWKPQGVGVRGDVSPPTRSKESSNSFTLQFNHWKPHKPHLRPHTRDWCTGSYQYRIFLVHPKPMQMLIQECNCLVIFTINFRGWNRTSCGGRGVGDTPGPAGPYADKPLMCRQN